MGIRAALQLSESCAGLDPGDSRRILALLERFELPLTLQEDITTSAILTHLQRDKKFLGDTRTFVLLERNGHAVLSNSVPEDLVAESIEQLRTPL